MPLTTPLVSRRLEFCFSFDYLPFALTAFLDMPTYEYTCEKCGKNFDAFQSMRDEPFRECPKELCRQKKWGHGKVKRLLGTGAGIIFKGSGFYSTDYRSASYQEGAKKEAPASGTETKKEKKEGTGATPPAAPAKGAETKTKKNAA